MNHTIRIWHGCKVICVVTVSDTGFSTIGPVGGAENSTNPGIELDPWSGLIVDNDTRNSPVNYREVQP